MVSVIANARGEHLPHGIRNNAGLLDRIVIRLANAEVLPPWVLLVVRRVFGIEHDAYVAAVPWDKNEVVVHLVLERELSNRVIRMSRLHRLNHRVLSLGVKRFWVVATSDNSQTGDDCAKSGDANHLTRPKISDPATAGFAALLG